MANDVPMNALVAPTVRPSTINFEPIDKTGPKAARVTADQPSIADAVSHAYHPFLEVLRDGPDLPLTVH